MYIPPGFNTITPYFVVENAERLVTFMKDAFGGEEVFRSLRPDGRIANTQIRVGTTTVMIGEARIGEGTQPTHGHFYLYVENCDKVMEQALNAGATLEMVVADMPYGDRQGGVRDVHGNLWWISQRLVEEPYSS